MYSDYFEKLFTFSTLHQTGFLTTIQRLDMTYYGSIALLIAYVLYLCFVPPLLRGKRDLKQFTSDLIAAQDAPAHVLICDAIADYLEPFDTVRTTSASEHIAQLTALREFVRHAARAQEKDGQLLAPSGLGSVAMRFYYNWKNEARPLARYVVFGFASIGFLLLFIPALDLFQRVLRTTFRQLAGA